MTSYFKSHYTIFAKFQLKFFELGVSLTAIIQSTKCDPTSIHLNWFCVILYFMKFLNL